VPLSFSPYHALLLLSDEKSLLSELPIDCSPALVRVIKTTSAVKNLQQLAQDADLALLQVGLGTWRSGNKRPLGTFREAAYGGSGKQTACHAESLMSSRQIDTTRPATDEGKEAWGSGIWSHLEPRD
jgi:hypothetical protein